MTNTNDEKKSIIIRELMNLSSGTIAGIINNSVNSEIDNYQSDLVLFADKNYTDAWENWQDVWKAFELDISGLDTDFETTKRDPETCIAIRFHRSATIPLEDQVNTGGNAYISAVFVDEGTERIPHIIRHSPAGFEWGYGGSGPSDTARSILTYLFGSEFADEYYQEFKDHCVSRMPKLGAEITVAGIIKWKELIVMSEWDRATRFVN